jgi:EmrB/QacA subfamily drug resistance transporter
VVAYANMESLSEHRPVSRYEPAPLQFVTRRSWYPWLVVGVTCIGGFIGQLDASIVQLALPTFERQFDANLDAVSWVAIAYLLAFAVALPVFARWSEIKGRKLLYLAGYAIFTLASALCGTVSDLRLLIAFRVLQGIGGALLGANSITILVKAAGPGRRGRAMGLFAAAQAVGISAGPVIGGLLLEKLGWRWIFLVSVPCGLVGVVVGWLALPQTSQSTSSKRFDWQGALLLTPALTSVVLMLNQVQAWGLKSGAMLCAVLVAAIFLPLFLWREWQQSDPLIDLHLFRSSAFSGGLAAVNLSYALLYSMFFLMSFLFIHGLRESPIAAGLRLALIPIALGLVAPISGSFYARVGARVMTTSAMLLCLGALVLLSRSLAGQTANYPGVMGALALFGAGLGMFIAPNNSATVAAAPDERTGEAGGLLNLMRALGCTIGIATASVTFSWRLYVYTGNGHGTTNVPTHIILAATVDVLWVLGGFAVAAGSCALLRDTVRRRVPGR